MSYCPPEFKHPNHHDYCRSPMACKALGYCRSLAMAGKLPPATLAGPGGVPPGSAGPARTPGDHKAGGEE